MSLLGEAAVVKILAAPAVQALIGTDIGQDDTGQPYAAGWVFRSSDNEMSGYRDPEGTGKASIVVAEREGWTSPNAYNTARFPTLFIVVYADSTRVLNGSSLTPTQRDARDRCQRIFDAVDPLFHDVANKDHHWPLNQYVVSCMRQTELTMVDVLNGDGKCQGISRYSVTLG